MAEREQLTRVGMEILDLLKQYDAAHFVEMKDDGKNRDGRLAIDKKILELSKHLGNIGGFCDSNSKRAIHVFTTGILDVSMLSTGFYVQLKALLPTIVGIQVDYTKKPPFKVMGVNVKALNTEVKAFLGR